MTSTTSEDPLSALSEARDRLERLRETFDADGNEIETVAEAYDDVVSVFDRWEERATDWDDFEGYIEFRNDVAETLETLPEDLPERAAFEEADRHVKTSGVSKSLSADDFEAAREALASAREYADHRDALAAAREAYRSAYRTARRRLNELDDRIEELRRLERLGEADLGAPVEELRVPIETYNEAIAATFEAFRRTASTRALLSFAETASGYPLVDFDSPPAELLAYAGERPAGEESLPELLEYADYSESKLDHYVEDPDLLKRRVATNRTYLKRLSSAPLRVKWPPSAAGQLRFRIEELVSVVARIDDREGEAVAALRDVRALMRRDDYDRLREAAVAREELADAERQRIADGDVASERSEAEAERERIDRALSEAPDPGSV